MCFYYKIANLNNKPHLLHNCACLQPGRPTHYITIIVHFIGLYPALSPSPSLPPSLDLATYISLSFALTLSFFLFLCISPSLYLSPLASLLYLSSIAYPHCLQTL